MKVGKIRKLVDRTTPKVGDVPGLIVAAARKSARELNSTDRLLRRTRRLNELVARPSRLEQERILGNNDLVDVNFMHRGLLAARAVCRVVLRNSAGRQIGVATGFLVSPRLLMTNNHVLPDRTTADKAIGQFDYQLDNQGNEQRGPSFKLLPERFFQTNTALDYSLVAISDSSETNTSGSKSTQTPKSISAYPFLRLDPMLGKVNEGEFITIVQHPSGLPKQVALRENRLLKIDTDFLVYKSDTAQGSSGSPLFNDTWQVVGLHSAGVPNKDAQGNWLTRQQTIATDDTEDSDIDWIGNTGARASRIVTDVRTQAGNEYIDELLAISESEESHSTQLDRVGDPFASQLSRAPVSTLRIQAVPGGARVELPTGFAASIDDTGAARFEQTGLSGSPSVRPLAAEAYRSPVIDTHYSNRRGYDETFLKEPIALPNLVDDNIAAPSLRNGDVEIPYQHFSIIMHKTRRLALLTACNVDTRDKSRQPDPEQSYTRAALGEMGPHDIEKWVAEPRISDEHQLPDRFFKNDRKAFDKGHVVKRNDVTWGRTYAVVRRANGDTFHVTNCSPQIAAFNRSSRGGDWGKLENMIARRADQEKVVIFAGPVLSEEDRPFQGEDANGEELIVKIPSRYWKIVIANGPDGLESYGFVLSQQLDAIAWEFDIDSDWVEKLVRVSEIEQLTTHLQFPSNVVGADMFDYIDADESLSNDEIRLTNDRSGGRPESTR